MIICLSVSRWAFAYRTAGLRLFWYNRDEYAVQLSQPRISFCDHVNVVDLVSNDYEAHVQD